MQTYRIQTNDTFSEAQAKVARFREAGLDASTASGGGIFVNPEDDDQVAKMHEIAQEMGVEPIREGQEELQEPRGEGVRR